MIDLQDKSICPALEEIGEYVRNPVFMMLCAEIKDTYQCSGCCGQKGKASVEEMLPKCTAVLQDIYHQTQEGNGQRWLMIDLEAKDDLYHDLLQLIRIRRNS